MYRFRKRKRFTARIRVLLQHRLHCIRRIPSCAGTSAVSAGPLTVLYPLSASQRSRCRPSLLAMAIPQRCFDRCFPAVIVAQSAKGSQTGSGDVGGLW